MYYEYSDECLATWRQISIIMFVIVCLLLLYTLATSEVISGWVLTCDNPHSWRLYSAASLGNQATSTMTCYPTQSHYADTEPTSPCPILIMLSVCKEVTNINFKVIGLTRLGFGNVRSRFEPMTFKVPDLPEWELDALLIQPPQLVKAAERGTGG